MDPRFAPQLGQSSLCQGDIHLYGDFSQSGLF